MITGKPSPIGPRGLDAVARQAARSVHGRRRSPSLTLTILLVLMLLLASRASGVATFAVACLVVLAIALRLLALLHVLRRPRPRDAGGAVALPVVTILIPLYREAGTVPALVAAIRRLDYPWHLLDVIALLEEDDPETLTALREAAPAEWRLVVVPDGAPRTKPRACNVGLALAKGEAIVIFDAEDRPEPDQPRKAIAALKRDDRLGVVQARLGCDHVRPKEVCIAGFWALEYAVLFGAIQPALARLGLPFLLGGTSNWFRTRALRDVGGWDAHNVTEDAELSIRLARTGWRSDVIDSTTWEEAPVQLRQWIRQRARWLMGFCVTTDVYVRRPIRLWRALGPAAMLAIVAQLPATLVCAAMHPFGLLLILTDRTSGPLWLLAAAGYAISLALHWLVARRHGLPRWLAFAMPLYWLLHAAALVLALVDLARDPTHWRKTEHGVAERPAPPQPRAWVARTVPWERSGIGSPANTDSSDAQAKLD